MEILFGILFGILLGCFFLLRILFGNHFGILVEIIWGILLGLNFSAGGVCGCASGGDKNRSLEARGLRTLALKKLN